MSGYTKGPWSLDSDEGEEWEGVDGLICDRVFADNEHAQYGVALVYGTGGWRAVVAYRWKGQFNENAKAAAWWNTFPELNHNETVGWEAPPEVTRRVELIVLRDRADGPRINRRIQVTVDIMAPAIAGVTQIDSRGESETARLFSLLYMGDYTSVYLAYLNEVDPSPVRVIDRLKAELAVLGPIA